MDQDSNKPVAYDVEGRPLYAAPQSDKTNQVNPQASSHVTAAGGTDTKGQDYDPQIRAQLSNEPHVVHTSRPSVSANVVQGDEIRRRAEESKAAYPHLNLSDGEFVILDIKRHPIGLILPIFATTIGLLMLSVLFIIYPSADSTFGSMVPSFSSVSPIIILLMILVGLSGFVVVWVYLQNQFYLTNESVVQEIQHSLFSRHEQTVSLGSIEDASFRQSGILQTMLNYGTIRLSTEGEETTYRFSYVANPHKQVAVLNNAIESFKNGRPVDPYEN